MKNLVVELDGVIDVAVNEVAVLIALWSPIAIEIEREMKYVNVEDRFPACDLNVCWKLIIGAGKQVHGTNRYGAHSWICEGSMTCKVSIDGRDVSVPIHTVRLEFFQSGVVRWLDVGTDSAEKHTDEIAEALSFGSVKFGERTFHFRKNWFPIIRKLASQRPQRAVE